VRTPDASRLPFSPLTHHELNTRALHKRDEAGGYALAVIRNGSDFHSAHRQVLEEIEAQQHAYHSAAMQRTLSRSG
jgi:hypothetical protein